MSIESVLQRVAALDQAMSNPASLLGAGRLSGGTAAPAPARPVAAAVPAATGVAPSFAEALRSAGAGYAAAAGTSMVDAAAPGASYPLGGAAGSGALALAPGTAGAAEGAGGRVVAIAESQIGQAEQPPGSNESPAIAQYRGATAGAVPGAPWCAYFASWAARQAGEPLGAEGEGLGSVGQIWSWAQSSGRAVPNGPGATPRPGDLIVFGGEHVGIVKDVLPTGQIQTIEGNYENKVSVNVRSSTEATGYVSMN